MPSPLSREVRRRARMVAGAARMTNATRAIADPTSVVRQGKAAPVPLAAGASVGAADGALVDEEAFEVGLTDGDADGSPPEGPSFCTVHGGADPVTEDGVGSKRTQP